MYVIILLDAVQPCHAQCYVCDGPRDIPRSCLSSLHALCHSYRVTTVKRGEYSYVDCQSLLCSCICIQFVSYVPCFSHCSCIVTHSQSLLSSFSMLWYLHASVLMFHYSLHSCMTMHLLILCPLIMPSLYSVLICMEPQGLREWSADDLMQAGIVSSIKSCVTTVWEWIHLGLWIQYWPLLAMLFWEM